MDRVRAAPPDPRGIQVHVLVRDRYALAAKSRLIPGIEPDLLASFVLRSDQTQAIREYRDALRR